MILADKIMTLRKKNGWSQEELASQLGVSRQSVSKWESAGSIPDLDKILQMSRIFGVSVDYLLKDELETEEYTSEDYPDSGEPIRRVSMDEAYGYMEATDKASRQIGFGVTLCILSPIPLLLFGLLSDTGTWAVSEDTAGALGIVLLLLLIAPAVALFIINGMALSRYEYLTQEVFDTEYGVDGMVGERKRLHNPIFVRNITVGVILCILSVIPMIFFAAMEASDLICGLCLCLLLAVVSLAVYLFVRAGLVYGCFDVLLQNGDHTRKRKQLNKKNSAISSVYWCVVTAGYLAYSFITGNWHISWVVWPVAGVLFGAVEAVIQMTAKA